MSTLINKVIEDSKDEVKEEFVFDNTQLSKYIMDLSLDQQIRIKALEMYYETNKDESIEIISRLTGMYQFSGVKTIQNFLITICNENVNIDVFLKLECAKSLLSFTEYEEDIGKDDDDELKEIKNESNNQIEDRNSKRLEIGYNCLNNICNLIVSIKEFPTPCKIDSVFLLMECQTYKEQSDTYFRLVINDLNINCDYRYKIILSLEKRIKDDTKTYYMYFIKNACLDFLNNSENKIMYRILSAQYLLQNCQESISENDTESIFKTLYSMAENKNNEYNLRADAADTLLRFGNTDYKNKAEEIILLLGRIDGYVRTIYDNAQNVHCKEIESSVSKAIAKIVLVNTMLVEENPIDFQYVKKQIKDILILEIPEVENKFEKGCLNCQTTCNDNKFCSEKCDNMYIKHSKIYAALNRIEMDRTLYSVYSKNLGTVVVKLWSYIQTNRYKDEMIKRLLEELEDMSGTCSSGFASRLVNVLSGFGEISFTISFTDQIISNFIGRLNKYARTINEDTSPFRKEKLYDVIELYIYTNNIMTKYPNINSMKKMIDEYLKTEREEKVEMILDDFLEKVLTEMYLDPNKFNDRRHFLLFFREYMLRIREELYEEFKDFVSDTEFDLCIRKAITVYEGVNFLL